MSDQIICKVDHSPYGAKAGAIVAIHLESDGELYAYLERIRAAYPRCDFAVLGTTEKEATK